MQCIAVLYKPCCGTFCSTNTRTKWLWLLHVFKLFAYCQAQRRDMLNTHKNAAESPWRALWFRLLRRMWLSYVIRRGKENVQTAFIYDFFRLFIIISVLALLPLLQLLTVFLLFCNFLSAQFVGSFCSPFSFALTPLTIIVHIWRGLSLVRFLIVLAAFTVIKVCMRALA